MNVGVGARFHNNSIYICPSTFYYIKKKKKAPLSPTLLHSSLWISCFLHHPVPLPLHHPHPRGSISDWLKSQFCFRSSGLLWVFIVFDKLDTSSYFLLLETLSDLGLQDPLLVSVLISDCSSISLASPSPSSHPWNGAQRSVLSCLPISHPHPLWSVSSTFLIAVTIHMSLLPEQNLQPRSISIWSLRSIYASVF